MHEVLLHCVMCIAFNCQFLHLCRFFEWNSKKQPFFAYFKENGPTEEMLELATLEKVVCACVC